LPLLAGGKVLLGEAETVDLVEVGTDGERRHVVGRLAGGGARRLVDHRVVGGDDLADMDLDLGSLRFEFPG
jgi:hypothetical protein